MNTPNMLEIAFVKDASIASTRKWSEENTKGKSLTRNKKDSFNSHNSHQRGRNLNGKTDQVPAHPFEIARMWFWVGYAFGVYGKQ